MIKSKKPFSRGDLVKLLTLDSGHGYQVKHELELLLGEVGEIISGGPKLYRVKFTLTNKLGKTFTRYYQIRALDFVSVFVK